MFVLLAKIVGCCGISCKNCHTWCQICNSACLRRSLTMPTQRKAFCKQPTPFPIIIPHHNANFKIVCKISPPNLRNRFAKGTSNTTPNAQNPAKTAPLPGKTQPLPQLPHKTSTIAHSTPHHFATRLWKGVANHLVAQLRFSTPTFANKQPTQRHQTNTQQQERYLQLCLANTQPEGMKKAPRKLLMLSNGCGEGI